MELELNAQTRILTDASDDRFYRRYLNKNQKQIGVPTDIMWRKQALLVTTETAEKAFASQSVPDEWADPWNILTRGYVDKPVREAWEESITVAGDRIATNVNRIQVKDFGFNSVHQSVKAWIDTEGGRLIVDLTAAQIGSVNALLQSQIALGVTSPYILAQRIKPIVGLTIRESQAVAKVITALTEEGLSPALITKQADVYAKRLHNNRAFRIARTEMANSYNFGQLDSIKQAIEAGELIGDPDKNWLAGGPNPCPTCIANAAAGAIPLNDNFQNVKGGSIERPTAHPHCSCSLTYSVRR